MRLKKRIAVPLMFVNLAFFTLISPPVLKMCFGLERPEKGVDFIDAAFIAALIAQIIIFAMTEGNGGWIGKVLILMSFAVIFTTNILR